VLNWSTAPPDASLGERFRQMFGLVDDNYPKNNQRNPGAHRVYFAGVIDRSTSSVNALYACVTFPGSVFAASRTSPIKLSMR